MIYKGALILGVITVSARAQTGAQALPLSAGVVQEAGCTVFPAATVFTSMEKECHVLPVPDYMGIGRMEPQVSSATKDTTTAEVKPGASAGATDTAACTAKLEGMLAGWLTASYSNKLNGQAGIRYIPGLSAGYKFGRSLMLDGEASVNTLASITFWSDDSTGRETRLKPYRLWVRFSGDRFEVRAGQQKINFGSAVMLRPLMWFDQIDPRDPLQLTDGVYALLARYYFLDNTNIWLWGLYGNPGRKGWDLVPSDKKKMEYGGRIEVPVSTIGEVAITGHHRMADYRGMKITDTRTGETSVSENRIGLDGKFDLGPGLWFEGTLTHQRVADYPYTRSINLGVDYTFSFGNGLHVMMEYLGYSMADRIFSPSEKVNLAALSATYPFSIFASLNAIVFYDMDNSNLYNFINWSWQFDKWSIYLIGFWNPDRFSIYRNLEGTSLFAGKGIQLMFVYNH